MKNCKINHIIGSISELDEAQFEALARYMHERQCGAHFNEHHGKAAVARMFHTDADGERHTGEHWTVDEAEELTSAVRGGLPATTTKWDIYVAINAFWHDFERPGKPDAQIVGDAVCFFFRDEDAPDGKIWNYISALD